MYAKRVNLDDMHNYIKSTREWINSLELDLDTLNYSKLLNKNRLNIINNDLINRFE